MEYGMIVYTVTLILAGLVALGGIYFLIYKWHINRAIKDPEKAKKSKVHLPSLGISYTGMWFVVWIVSVVITLMMIMDVLYITRTSGIYAESNSNMLNYIEERLIENADKIDEINNELMNERYVSEKNAKFELGNFNAEKNTIDLKVTISDINMAEGDTVKWRMNGRTLDLTQDLTKKTYTGIINMDIMEFDVDYTLDSVFISEVDGIKRIDRIYKYNRYYYDEMFGIDETMVPANSHYLPEGDFGEYWEDYFAECGASMYEADAAGNGGYNISRDGNKYHIDGVVFSGLNEAIKVKGRKAVSAKIVLEVDGKKVAEQNISQSDIREEDGERYAQTLINMDANNVKSDSKVGLYIEGTDNYGYVMKSPVYIIGPDGSRADMEFTLKDKDGNIIYSEKAE